MADTSAAREKKNKIPFPAPASPEEKQEDKAQPSGHLDRPLLMIIFLLLGMGLVCLFSASYATSYDTQEGDPIYFILRQGIFAAGGVVVMLALSKYNYHRLHYFAIPALILAIAVMATVKIPGLSQLWINRKGAIRWMKIPAIGQFQPSELAKVATILFCASMATILGKKKMHTLRWGLLPFLGVVGVFALELKWEKHLSATLIIAAIALIIVFFAGANLFWLGLGGAGVTAGGIAYVLTQKYAKIRIDIWLDPFKDPQGDGWQGVQSQLAIGSGGFWGLGLGQGRQKHLYLPEPANDFIFAVICEELGFLGATLVVVAFALLIWRGYYIALNAADKFGTLLAAGITTQIAVQTFLNLGVVTGLLPITGASLPFFSYGGTALLIQLAEMGILLSISRDVPAPREG